MLAGRIENKKEGERNERIIQERSSEYVRTYDCRNSCTAVLFGHAYGLVAVNIVAARQNGNLRFHKGLK